jgi:hypothetical protein
VGAIVSPTSAVRTAWVPETSLARLHRRVESLAARCGRLGGEIELRDTGERTAGAEVLARVELRGRGPVVNGWRAIARLRHAGERNEVESLDGEAVDVGRWQLAEARCEHCGLRRRRSITFVLRHESGQLAQVGSSCVGDFTGGRNPLADLGAASAVQRQAAEELTRAAAPRRVALAEYLGHVAASVAEAGRFVSKAEAAERGAKATWEAAKERLERGAGLSAGERDIGIEIESWVLSELREDGERSRFESRLVAVFELAEHVEPERMAIAAAAFPAFQAARRRAAVGEACAEVGEWVESEVEVVEVRPVRRRSRYGQVFWHTLRDREGHWLAWYAVGRELEPGRTYALRGRVRRHDHRGERVVTVLERCRVDEED